MEILQSASWPDIRADHAVSTREARALAGKGARAEAPRPSHGDWKPAAQRRDPVETLMEQAADRVPELVPVRNGRMLASPFAFFRGGAAVMAADLAPTPVSGITVQLCGDAHVSNFGGYASPDRELVFDLNDFDETLPGPWEWDLKRLVASLAIAGRDRGFDDRERTAIVRSAAGAYRGAMREFAELGNLQVWYARLTAGDVRDRWGATAGRSTARTFDRQVEKAMKKDSARALSRLTHLVDGRPRINSDPPLLVPVDELLQHDEAAAFEQVVEEALRSYRRSLPAGRRQLIEQFSYVEAARKVVGVGSVGTRAWVVLMLGTGHDDPLFLQLKEARKSVLAAGAGRSRFDQEGQRVVVGQQLLQASSDIFLGWTRVRAIDGVVRDFYIRQLWDWKLSADVGRQSPRTMAVYAQMCGWVLARGHARTGDRIAIAGYLGRGDAFDIAMTEFAELYADQNEHDYELFMDAAREQRIQVTLNV
jgi:uncharacterized protein (DUF2252 family)